MFICPQCKKSLVDSEHTPWIRTCGYCNIVCVFKEERDEGSQVYPRPNRYVTFFDTEPVNENTVFLEPSERRRVVLQLKANGLSNPEIADRLGIALNTVKEHCKILFQELGARNVAHAVHIAHKQELL